MTFKSFFRIAAVTCADAAIMHTLWWKVTFVLMVGPVCAQDARAINALVRLPALDESTAVKINGPADAASQPRWTPGEMERFFNERIPTASTMGTATGPPDSAFVPCAPPKCRCWDCVHEDHESTGFIDFNTYWDTREQTVTTLNILANLPGKLQYFQFFNFESAFDRGSHDWTGFYTEMNLRRPIHESRPWLKAMDWNLQYADGSAPHGALRLGTRLRFHDAPGSLGAFTKDKLDVRYSLTIHFLEADGSGVQLEHTARRDFWDGRVYVFCFCDHNLDNDGRDSTWVTETQLGLLLAENLYAVAEYRYNSFLPAAYREGLGLGLEYVVRFR